MDACFMSSDEREGFSALKGELDSKIESILGRLTKGNYDQVAKEILSNFTKSALLESRKKIFSCVVAKDEKKRSLATNKRTVNKGVPSDKATSLGPDLHLRRLVNRRSKPRIADDIVSMVLHIKHPGDAFPEQILQKQDTKRAESPNEDPEIELETEIVDDWADDFDADGPEDLGNDEQIVVTTTKLRDSHTSTTDLVLTRTIATQTIVSDLRKEALAVEARCNLPQATPNVDKPASNEVEESESASHPPSPASSPHSERSILEYIDEEYESLKMSKSARKIDSTNNEKQLVALNDKYNAMMRRVIRLEKKHENDIKTLRDELQARHEGPPRRRHSESDMTSPKTPFGEHEADPFDCSTESDTSVWDVSDTDMMVKTQDSQGNPVTTRATPFHVKEKAASEAKACSCVVSDPKTDTTKSSKIVSAPSIRNRNTRPTTTRRNERPGEFPPDPTQGNTTSARPRMIDAAASRNTRDTSRMQTSGGEIITERAAKPGTTTRPDNKRVKDTDPKRRKLNAEINSQPGTSGYQPTNTTNTMSSSGKCASTPEHDNTDNENAINKSFAVVASEGTWLTVGSNGNKDKGKKREYPAIKSAAPPRNRELYVKGMSCANFKMHKDLEEAVKWYCKDRSVNTIHQRVIMYNRDNDSVGIKVVVREGDVEKMTAKGFWPEGIWIRDWSDEKPTERERYFGNRSSSDESL